ncbi:VCBS repeat-containing protein [Chondrinema litorale]|uniref:VCBS repeat-containing protein n=1 Tax=Chondrinema litorale TaxID=2994555 RepID=UPI002543A186|nr:VCBS repeat-containing protein [Chondrinema litorale]UZR96958.1 VCBS repeat-containing protein [Chondrinema litorale]
MKNSINNRIVICLNLFLITLAACHKVGIPDNKLFEYVPSEHSGIEFSNTLFENENLNIITFEYFYNGAGVGTGDLNNDGLADVFFAGNMTNCKLYLNKGDFQFEDVTEKAGISTSGKWATGVSLVDINQDGWLDIYVSYSGPYEEESKRANELYINNQNGTFKEMAADYGLADTGHSIHAAFFDYDLDGDLDMYLLTNMTDRTGPNVIRPKRVRGEMLNTDRLYRNNGKDSRGIYQYENVSKEAGITIEGYGLGVSVADINLDGWPDIYVSNDYLSNDLLYINNHDGTFTNKAKESFQHQSYSAMGNDVADINNDGWPDIVTVDMLPADNKRKKLMFGSTNYDRFQSELYAGYEPQYMRNTMQLHRGLTPDGKVMYSEVGQMAGIDATDWSWSALIADYDNDGYRDIHITNGYPRDITNRDFATYKSQELQAQGFNRQSKLQLIQEINKIEGAYLPNYFFQNKDGITFSDVSDTWLSIKPSYSSGAAYADFDNDGDLDLIINNIDEKAFLLKNNSDKYKDHHFLNLALKGSDENINGIGTKISLFRGKEKLEYFHYPYRGFQSSVENKAHFGLGTNDQVDSIKVIWPDGKSQTIIEVAPDKEMILLYSNAMDQAKIENATSLGLLSDISSQIGLAYKHQEKSYPDFKVQPLLPHQYSQNGPDLAVADINGDGLEDFYVTGSYSYHGTFFLQQKNGSFTEQTFTLPDSVCEEVAAVFFDVDNDGDQDLYLVNGSNEFNENSPYYQDHLYLNDGSGNFSDAIDVLPKMNINSSCIAVADYDNDGDLDLFLGGSVTPGKYPLSQPSIILRNEGGKFKDVSQEVCPTLKKIGLISEAIWSDFDDDQLPDLILTGEWMSLRFFKNTGNTFEEVTQTTGLQNYLGWWNCITPGDFDNDGDIDYIAGNLGLNSKFKASDTQPVELHVADFDKNGSMDGILSRYIQGKRYPVHPRMDVIDQMNAMKKKFPRYEDYATSTLEEVIDINQTGINIYKANYLQSAYIENLGNGKFNLKPLPKEAQFAPVSGMVVKDLDNDGNLDILLTGNSFTSDVLTGRYDASFGLVILGDGKGNFTSLTPTESGFCISGDTKSLKLLNMANGESLFISAKNQGRLSFFESKVKTMVLP